MTFQHMHDDTELTITVQEQPFANGFAALVDMLPPHTRTLPVFLQDEWMDANNIAQAVLMPGLGDFHEPHIVIDSDAYKLLLNEDDDAIFTLLHETGHFVNGDRVCALMALRFREDRSMAQAFAWNTSRSPHERMALLESQLRQDALCVKYGLCEDDENDEE